MAKVKDDQVSATVKISLQVPRGLLELLAILQKLGGEEPKAYLERTLTNELECILGSMPEDIFDVGFIRTRFGEGSDVYKPKEIPDNKVENEA